MKIAREDVNRMKELAMDLSKIRKNPVAIHQKEHGFVDYMTAKYGEQTAITMLTKVWKMSSQLKAIPDMEV
jgi:hypothetical protein